jgi:hypothetical protein
MNAKTRIQKLESTVPTATDNRQLKRVIGADGNRFYIDGVQVGYEVYVKAETAQLEKAHGEYSGIVINFVPPLPEGE